MDRYAERYLSENNLLPGGPPNIYQLPLEQMQSKTQENPVRYMFGKKSSTQNVKSIMVTGATGSGKTTLINSMVNYILGVEWKDTFRYKLIHKETNRSQAESQTSSVTVYELNHQEGFRVPYSLIIVDTPGFGDTRGIERDNEITKQFREFFTSTDGLNQINAVCFVVQASLPQLNPTQKYIMDSILSLFGKDIAENIRVMVTFADGKVPPVLEAINQSGIPFPKDDNGRPIHFKFNNSAILGQPEFSEDCDSDDENFDQMFWEMGSKNMKRFFTALDATKPNGLRLTKEVIQEWKQLDITVQGIQEQIKLSVIKLEAIRKTQVTIEKHEAQMEQNINFEYEFEVTKSVKMPISGTRKQATNCRNCKVTCHYPCLCSDWWKYFCGVFDKWGNCSVCPGKCKFWCHKLENDQFMHIIETEKRTYAELKACYEKAYGEKMTDEKLKEKLKEEDDQNKSTVQNMVETLTVCLARLNEIALNPNPLSTLDCIDLMIVEEKQEGKPGFQERIQLLNQMKQKVDILAKVIKGESLSPEENKECGQQQQAKKSETKTENVSCSTSLSDGDEKPTSPEAEKQ